MSNDDQQRPVKRDAGVGAASRASESAESDGSARPTAERRRRFLITSIAAPTILSLPSRRVWAAKCTKSKLLSGNLSAHQKKLEDTACVAGCNRSFWQNAQTATWAPIDPEGPLVDATTLLNVYRNENDRSVSATVREVLNKDIKPPPDDTLLDGTSTSYDIKWGGIKGKLESLGQELVPAIANSLILNHADLGLIMEVEYPIELNAIITSFNDIINDFLATSAAGEADDAKDTANSELELMKQDLQMANNDGVCPLELDTT